MTATLTPGLPTSGRGDRPVLALAGIEARRFVRSMPFWIGAGLTILNWTLPSRENEEWTGAAYQHLMGVTPPFLYIGTFISAVIIGMRDHVGDATPVVGSTPVDAGSRVVGKLLGGMSLVAVTSALLAAGYVWLEIDGGIAIGTERVMPQAPGLALILALTAFAVATGITVGQFVRSRAVVIVGGSILIFLTSVTSWIFGSTIDLTPAVTYNPMTIDLGEGFVPSTAPSSWILDGPDEPGSHWTRLSFEQAALSFHVAYVVGLTLLAWALARRAHGASTVGRTLGIVGATITIGAGIAQFAVRTGTYV